MMGFEGYVGIPLGGEQEANDVMFALLLVMLSFFSLVFRANYPLFFNMVRGVFFPKRRSFSPEKKKGNSVLYRLFMTFQTLFLSSFSLFELMRCYGYILDHNETSRFFYLGIIFFCLYLFYLSKQFIYGLLGYVFAAKESYNVWRNMYNAVFGSYGVLLYLPALGLVFAYNYAAAFALLFLILYVACRFVIIYKTVDIFYQKSMSLFYLSLYLCTQEIIPLFLLYKGFIYLYNFIESGTLWR